MRLLVAMKRQYKIQDIGISYTDNPKEYMKVYYSLHSSKMKRNAMERYSCIKNESSYKERVRTALKVWRKNNSEKYNEQSRKYYHANREAALSRMENRRARRISAGPIWTKRDIIDQYEKQNGRCFYCCKPVTRNEFHTDHIVALARGGSNGRKNLAISCAFCNASKGTQSMESFILRLFS
jgi:5-methylcytosine-specific restriction endonuclease McrA